MSKYNIIKTATDAYIKANGRREITGPVLNAILNAIIESLGKYYQMVGVALPADDPGTPDQNVAFLAGTPGTYTKFGNSVVAAGEIALLKYDGEWSKAVLYSVPTEVSDLTNDLGFVTNSVNDLLNYYLKTETYTKGQVDSLIAAVKQFRYIVTDTLPTASADTMNIIYLVPSDDPMTGDVKDEYITIEVGGVYSWEKIGRTDIDLSNYPTNAQMAQAIDDALAAYITGINATIDNNHGTPSVNVQYASGILTLAFHNLKGDTGERGPVGVESVNVAVDNNTGIPTATATMSGGVLTLNFYNLKGAQGNSGYQGAAGELLVVNNLTDGGATAALSAEMGKVLQGEISQLEAKVVSVVAKDVGTQYKSVYVGNDTSIGAIGDIIDDTSANSFAVELPLPTGAKSVTFYGRKWSSGARGYAFLASDNSVLSYGGFSASANITIDVPSGSAKVRLSLYTGHKDVTITSEVHRTTILDNVDGAVGYTIGLDSARLVIRALPSTTSTTDTPNGTRIRIVFQVNAGMKLYAHTTDPNGLLVGVWDTLKNAVQASPNAGVVQASVGFTTDWIEYEINADGFLLLSLKNDVAISDARKQEMIDSISFVLGTGLEYEVGKQSLVDGDTESRLDAIENPELPYAYYGEKINLGGFDWFRYAINSLGAQSSARYGDYLFSVQDKLTKIICYNLRTKELLYTLTPGISAEDYWHCNQCSFSTKFYADGDMFPVLYVSTQNDPNGVCYALGFRIIPVLTDGEISSFSVTLVQTIQFPAMSGDNCLGNVNTAFDTQRGYMWTYSRNKDSSAQNFNKARFTKWAIPELTNSLVQLTDADILDAFSDDWSMFNAQGGFIRNGKLVIMQGYESAGYINCRVIDLYLEKKQTSLIDLLAIGFPYEPEGCFYWDGMIMTQTSGVTIVGIRFS